MSKPDAALIFPISDIDLSRDAGSKLRIAGTVTAIDPHCSSIVLVSDLLPTDGREAASLLIETSLCSQHTEVPSHSNVSNDAGGWRTYRHELKNGAGKGPGVVPPELKTKVMIIGHLVRRDLPLDISFVSSTQTPPLIEPKLHASINQLRTMADQTSLLPNPYFLLEALVFKPLPPTFDLALWNHTSRLRSHHQWSTHNSKAEPKRKARD